MNTAPAILPLMLTIGAVFGALAAAGAYAISLAEYRKRWLRPDQRPRRMAFEVALMTFAFFVVAAAVLGFILGHTAR